MHEREYLKLRRDIRDRCQRDLAALERVWRIATNEPLPRETSKSQGKKDPAPPAPPADSAPSEMPTGSNLGKGQLVKAVKTALSEISKDQTFRAGTICEFVTAQNPDLGGEVQVSSVSQVLKRMHDRGEIEMVLHAAGRRPATYKKK